MRVYVAGPLRSDPISGTWSAVHAADRLRKAGHTPYVPHLCVLWNSVHPHEESYWLALDLEWLRQCEALVRLDGDSEGADIEVMEAVRRGIPIYFGVDDLCRKDVSIPEEVL